MRENTFLNDVSFVDASVSERANNYVVNTDLLYSGQVFKNFKQLATTMGWKYHNSQSNSTKSQQKSLSAVCDWSFDIDRETGKKLSNRVLIHEVYNEPGEIVDLRKRRPDHYIKHENYNVPYEQNKDIGVYKVSLGSTIYIGSTRVGFRKRFLGHLYNRGQMPFLDQLYDEGGVFEIVEVMNGSSDEEIFQRENEYIEQYLNDTNWVCLNRRPSYNPNRFKQSPYTILRVNRDQYEEIFALLSERGYDIKPFKSQTEEGEIENE